MPMAMLQSPKKRIWPLLRPSICSNTRRHAEGETSGNSPSMTSTNANAAQSAPLSKADYFLEGAGAGVLLPFGPRMDLKNSEEGSSTITSFFLLKLALYASRLR